MPELSNVDSPAAVSVMQAARMLGISRAAAYNYVKSGELESVRLGGRVLIPIHRLRAFLDGETASTK